MRNGRNSIGYEIDKSYSYARKRIHNSSDLFSTGKVSVHEET